MAKDKLPPDPGTVIPPSETISVSAVQLQEVLDKLKAQDETIANLTAAVSQNKLAEIISSKKPKELPRVFLKVFQGKVVIGWQTAKSRYIYGTGTQAPIGEVLQSTYTFLDGTRSEPVDQVEFSREDTRLWCRLQEGLKAIQDPESRNWTVIAEQLETGDENLKKSFVLPTEPIKIDRNFVNP